MNQWGDHEKIFCPILAINLTDAAYWTDLGSRTTPLREKMNFLFFPHLSLIFFLFLHYRISVTEKM